MKKLRKALALLLGMVMVLSLMPQAVLGAKVDDAYLYGWTRTDNAGTDASTTDESVSVSSDYALTGSNSLHVRNEPEHWISIGATQQVAVTAGTYNISFWFQGLGEPFINIEGVASDATQFRLNGDAVFTNNGTNNGFTNYTHTITFTESGTVTFKVGGVGYGANYYADDIYFAKQGTTTNLLVNPSFEEPEPTYTTEFDNYFYGWRYWENGTAVNGNTLYKCVTNQKAHSGNHSLVVKHTVENGGGLAICNDVAGTGDFTLSFWATGMKDGKTNVIVNGPWTVYNTVATSYAGETDGDWTKYTITFTVDGTAMTGIVFSAENGTAGWYIDDVSLTASGSTKNLIKNGGFEETEPIYTTEFDDYFYGWRYWENGTAVNGTTLYKCVTNQKAHSGNHSLLVKHTVANGGGLAICNDVAGTGDFTLSFWAIGMEDGKTNVIVNGPWTVYNTVATSYAGETDGDWTKYTITFTVDGTAMNGIVFSAENGTAGWFIDDISLTAMGDTVNLIKNPGFEDDGKPDYTDSLDAYMTGWVRDDSVDQNGSTIFSCVTDEVSHSGNNSFVFRYDGSLDGEPRLRIKQENLSLGEGTYTLSYWAKREVTDDWKDVIWLSGGTFTRDNSDWDYAYNMKTNETDGEWTKYSVEFTVASGSTMTALILTTSGQTTALYIDDVSIVASGSTTNLLSNPGFEQKSLNGYYISSPKVAKADGTVLDALEAGTHVVSIEVANYSMGDNFAPILIIALYNGGTLESMEYVEQGSAESGLDGFLADEFGMTVTVPEETDGADYSLKVMCWESWSNLTPLVTALELE